jgi:hypothetical protein
MAPEIVMVYMSTEPNRELASLTYTRNHPNESHPERRSIVIGEDSLLSGELNVQRHMSSDGILGHVMEHVARKYLTTRLVGV